ncbi:MAG: glycoside hydrolase family 127 protein [Anaerolineales bacterium]
MTTSFFPLRDIRPSGWLQDFLERQASGLTGNVAVSGYPYGYKFWGTKEDDTKGSYSAWWPYEQTAYWIDGALKAGYLAGADELYNQALEEVDFAIEHADADGFIGPESLRDKDRWPHAVFFRAVLAQYEITGDYKYIDALIKHYRSMPHPMGWDRDVTGVEILLYLYQESGEADLLEMAEKLYESFNRKWPEHDAALKTLLSDKEQSEHGVTFNEEAKLAAMLYTATGKKKYLRAVEHGYQKLYENARLADGLHSASEHIHGKTALDMHETCDLTDHTWALTYLLQATGKAKYADQIEQIVFNALPGSITKDFHALQYFSAPNQVIVTSNSSHNPFMCGLNWMSYRPDHEVQCCPGNVHRTMPNFIHRMWMRAEDGGIMAAMYGPGDLHATVGKSQTLLTISATTDYPYQQEINFLIDPEKPVRFAFYLRIPEWCRKAKLRVNGKAVQAKLRPGSFFRLERLWKPGDEVQLEMPFTLAIEHFPDNGISLRYGPLTLAFPIPTRAEIETENSTVRQQKETMREQYVPRPIVVKEEFPAWNLYPDGAWNYALQLDEDSLKNLIVEWNDSCTDPLDASNPPLKVRVPAKKVRGWKVVRAKKIKQFGHWTEGDRIHARLADDQR